LSPPSPPDVHQQGADSSEAFFTLNGKRAWALARARADLRRAKRQSATAQYTQNTKTNHRPHHPSAMEKYKTRSVVIYSWVGERTQGGNCDP
jgi:hypothetical protein